MEIHIKTPTRGMSCLDLFASNVRKVDGQVHYLALSDHETGQTLRVPVKNRCNIIQWYENRRDFCDENKIKFTNSMAALSFSELYEISSVNDKFAYFHDNFKLFFNLCFPTYSTKKTNKIKKSRWLTKGIKKSSIRKRCLYLKLKLARSNKKVQESKYKKYSNLLKKCIHKSQQIQNLKYIQNSSNTCKAVWQTINENIGETIPLRQIDNIKENQSTYTDVHDICEVFNQYFINLTNQSNFTFNSSEISNYLTSNVPFSIFLQPTDPTEILKVIRTLRNTNSVGVDGLNTKIIKLSANYICKPLSHIINQSFEQGIFPETLKQSIVKPLYKKGEKSDMNNYRPVTLIPVISKIFEKVMLIRLQKYVTAFDILKSEQFGFRKNRTTSLACYNVVKLITEAINGKIPVVALLLDMSKAFDFVDHKLLLYKLEKYGIRGKANDWIHSYLEDRQQCVEVTKILNGKKTTVRSDFRINQYGVPQGSVLGPFLFLMYINDLPNITKHKTILFADDTTIIIRGENKLTFESDINEALSNTIQWLTKNNLQVNINKTNIIQFGTQNQIRVKLDIKYNYIPIVEVENAKFLGIYFDCFCNWKAHVHHVCDKLDKFVYAIRRLRLTVSTDAALNAYHGYVSSVLAYGIILWGNSVEIDKAFKVQKKCVRAICGAWSTDSCKPLFKRFNILPLTCMYIKDICLFVKQYPEYFRKKSEVLTKSTRHKDRLYVPPCRLELVKRNVCYHAITIFNKLPQDIKDLPLNTFKLKLKKWLLDNCFYDIKEYLDYKI